MYAFHRILADYSPLVEYYILDARGTKPTDVLVQLTVLVHPFTSQHLIARLQKELNFCMPWQELDAISEDFDLPVDEDVCPLWKPFVQRSAVPL